MKGGPVRSPGPPVAVLAVGDELLLGETVDTNGSWLCRELSHLGFDVVRWEVVGDVESEIQGALRRALGGADVVVVTGGLGPTADDLTRESVARLFGRELEEREDLLEDLRQRFRARGISPLPPNSRRMALVPRGGRILPNPRGAAPGLVFQEEDGLCILLPGIPGEMKALFRDGAAPLLRERYGDQLRPVFLRTIYTSGIPESVLSREVGDALSGELGPVSLAFLPDVRGVRIRLTARGLREEEEAETWFSRVEEELRSVLAPYLYASEEGDLAQALGDALLARQATVATAESCTGGLIAKRLTDYPGSSGFFLGGVVAYENQKKTRFLDVPASVLEEHGAVSKEVAQAMAAGVAGRFGSEAGIGVTGIAGPGGGTPEKPVGTVWYAAVLGDRVQARRQRFPGDRHDVRERSAQAAIDLLYRMLTGMGS